jgi:hypothetical protein
MNIVDKKALLRKLLAESKRGFHLELVRLLSISLKTLWNWEKGKQWPNLEQEKELWEQLGYKLREDGSVKKRQRPGPTPLPAAPVSPDVGALLALFGELLTHHRALAPLYASLEELLIQGVNLPAVTPGEEATAATVRHLQQVENETRHALSQLQPPVPTLPPLLPVPKTLSPIEDSEYDS